MPKPIASIVIPVYNQKPDVLGRCVTSALNQTVPVEVIVVDDGSESPVAYLAPTRVIWRGVNGGIAAALNTGIAAMRTDWFCWLSSDDLITPDKVERQLAALTESGCKAGFHPYDCVTPGGERLGYSQPPQRFADDLVRLGEQGRPAPGWWTWPTHIAQRKDFSRNCWVNGSTAMIHRSVIEDVGTVPGDFRYGQDWMWWVKIGQKYRWCFVNRLLGRRTEGGNLTERIMSDPALLSIKQAEDRRIIDWANERIHE